MMGVIFKIRRLKTTVAHCFLFLISLHCVFTNSINVRQDAVPTNGGGSAVVANSYDKDGDGNGSSYNNVVKANDTNDGFNNTGQEVEVEVDGGKSGANYSDAAHNNNFARHGEAEDAMINNGTDDEASDSTGDYYYYSSMVDNELIMDTNDDDNDDNDNGSDDRHEFRPIKNIDFGFDNEVFFRAEKEKYPLNYKPVDVLTGEVIGVPSKYEEDAGEVLEWKQKLDEMIDQLAAFLDNHKPCLVDNSNRSQADGTTLAGHGDNAGNGGDGGGPLLMVKDDRLVEIGHLENRMDRVLHFHKPCNAAVGNKDTDNPPYSPTTNTNHQDSSNETDTSVTYPGNEKRRKDQNPNSSSSSGSINNNSNNNTTSSTNPDIIASPLQTPVPLQGHNENEDLPVIIKDKTVHCRIHDDDDDDDDQDHNGDNDNSNNSNSNNDDDDDDDKDDKNGNACHRSCKNEKGETKDRCGHKRSENVHVNSGERDNHHQQTRQESRGGCSKKTNGNNRYGGTKPKRTKSQRFEECHRNDGSRQTCIDMFSQESVISQLCTRMASLADTNQCVTSQLVDAQTKADEDIAKLETQIGELKNTIDKLQRSSVFYAKAPFGSTHVKGYQVKASKGEGFDPTAGTFVAPYDGVYQITVGYSKTSTTVTNDQVNVMLENTPIFRLLMEATNQQRIFVASLKSGQSLWLKTSVKSANDNDSFSHVGFGVLLLN